jgi:hypothetical protein
VGDSRRTSTCINVHGQRATATHPPRAQAMLAPAGARSLSSGGVFLRRPVGAPPSGQARGQALWRGPGAPRNCSTDLRGVEIHPLEDLG